MQDEKNIRDQEWLYSLRNGCRNSFTAIYNEYWYPVFLFAYRKIEVREIAEEIVQEIFTKLWRDRENLNILNLSSYLFSSARYEVIDHIRKNILNENYQKYYQTFCKSENKSTEDTIYYNDLVNNLNHVALGLPQKTRDVFYYSRIKQWPVSRIAEHLSISEKTVEYHLTRATKFMKNALKEHLTSISPFALYYIKNFL